MELANLAGDAHAEVVAAAERGIHRIRHTHFGVPWAVLHLPLVLPGMLNAGVPMTAEFLMVLALSVLLTWAYLGGGRSLGTAVVLHGGQTALAPLNNGLDPVAAGWLQAAVYGLAAMLVVLLTRGRLGLPRGWRETGTAHTDNRGHPRVDDDPADRGTLKREHSKR